MSLLCFSTDERQNHPVLLPSVTETRCDDAKQTSSSLPYICTLEINLWSNLYLDLSPFKHNWIICIITVII